MKNKNTQLIVAVLDAWKTVVNTHEEQVAAINNNQHLSPFGKAEKIKELQRNMEDQQQEALATWKKAWEGFAADTKSKGKESSPADRTAAMQMIMSVGDTMDAQAFASVLEPIKHDVNALRMVKPLIEKQGRFEEFKKTEAYRYMDAANKLQYLAEQAQKEGAALMDEDNSFKFAIRKGIMTQYLEGADEQLSILNEMEG